MSAKSITRNVTVRIFLHFSTYNSISNLSHLILRYSLLCINTMRSRATAELVL
jgi:hypothetical protein